MGQQCIFRRANVDDVSAILEFGNSTPELKVSAEADFMSREEVMASVTSPHGVFLLAESDGVLIGFSYAHTLDLDCPPVASQACLVYLAVRPDHCGSGLGSALYAMVTDELKSRGVTYIYAWAHPTSGVIEFMQRRGWAKGKPCVWMDIKL